MPSPTLDRRLLYGIPLALAALLLIIEPTHLDFALADLFYVRGQGFIGRRNDFLEDILHDRAKQMTMLIGLIALGGYLLSLLPTRLRPLRKRLGYLVLAMTLSTGFVVPLKKITRMQCPWSLEQYGGVEHFSPLLGPRAEPVKTIGNCWPGGHASSGFALIALFFFWRDNHSGRAKGALVAALALGSLFSVVRMAQGAHFLSHNVWTALICWLVCLGLYDLLLYRPARQQQSARAEGLEKSPR
ncbi:phosphatase PAP2 family protein [Pseudomonas sp. LRF_L74]|uniref:phosphatase PAP2 family protein n=1 Tax=Pseudomonas sp. LRF_L74 TaxID=3369422 RepID=UPI003F60599C